LINRLLESSLVSNQARTGAWYYRVGRYVAQVQISSVLENSVRTVAKDMTDLILDFLPDENGKVKATEFQTTARGVLK